MIKALFGEVKTGRLVRMQYLGYSVLLSLLMLGFGFAVVSVIGAGEQLVQGDLQLAQEQLREKFTLPFILLFAMVMPLFVFVGGNIMAKRIRDIGLPGWWMVLAIFLVSGAVSYGISDHLSNGLNTLIWLVLLLVPTNALAKATQSDL